MKEAPIEHLRANARNPRKNFDEAQLLELADSIREHGILQPIVVRPVDPADDGAIYEIVAGERRWRAAQRIPLHTVPVICIDADDQQALAMAVVENVQRADLSAFEEMMGYSQLYEIAGCSHEEIAQKVGRSRSHITNTLRLLKLPKRSLDMLEQGQLSATQARALLSARDPDALSPRVVKEGLTVEQIEHIIAKEKVQPKGRSSANGAGTKDANIRAIEKRLSDHLGLAVSIKGNEPGVLSIKYETLEQFDALSARLEGQCFGETSR
jgi:ParB family chromosome partitioning protein